MNKELHRHDISDSAWEESKPHTIGENGTRGGNAKNTWPFINGVFWVLRTEAPWRDFPAEYGHWKNVHRKFCRWRDKGIRENILAAQIDDADFEGLMINVFFVHFWKWQEFFTIYLFKVVLRLPRVRANRPGFNSKNAPD